MELYALRCFLTVVQEGNISRAAEVLHMTQPALSRKIAQLEEEVGVQLFLRGKHLLLTDAGVLLHRRSEEVVQLVEKVENEFREQGDIAGTVTIGVGGQYAITLLLDAMQAFRKQHPKVQYDFYTSHADHIKERLDHGLLDFGLLLEPIDVGKYDFIRLRMKERWGIFMQAGCPLAKKEAITKQDLCGVPLITTNRLSLLGEIAHWFGEQYEGINLFATYNIFTNVAKMVDSGVACALVLEGAVVPYHEARLAFRPLSPELSMTSVLAWKKFTPFSGSASKLLEFFKTMQF